MLDQLRRWMYGRHGGDELSFALIGLYFVLTFIGTIFSSGVIYFIAYIPGFYAIFRILSKNRTKRIAENGIFLQYFNPVKRKFQKKTKQWKDRKTYKYYKCKSCGQTIRVPKGKGKIQITCPKCKFQFIKKT